MATFTKLIDPHLDISNHSLTHKYFAFSFKRIWKKKMGNRIENGIFC